MPTRREINRTAREMLGRMAFGGFREYGVLARRLDADERIEAMAISRLRGGGLIGSQRIVVATDRRLVMLEKGFFTGRERLRTVDWDDVAGVEVDPPQRLDLVLYGAGERISLQWVQPPRQMGAIADLVRTRRDPLRAGTPTTGELLDMARSRLGRMLALAVEMNVLVLAGELDAGEDVLDLASAAGKPQGLVAATTARLVFVPARGLGAGAATAIPYDRIRGITLVEGVLAVDDGSPDGLRLHDVAPPERAEALVLRVSSRASATAGS